MTQLPRDFHPEGVTREEAYGAVGEGWQPLLDPLFAYCAAHGIAVLQVKEKFGGLRFYTSGSTPELSNMIQEAEEESFRKCEDCGAPGTPGGRGWIRTLCEGCRAGGAR